MLLFSKRFLEGIVRGEITLTFRRWEKPKVRPGHRYRTHPIGVLEVTDLREVRFGEIRKQDAARAGFASVEELRGYLQELSDEPITADTPLYRVEFAYAGDGDRVDIAMNEKISAREFDELRTKLERMDERSSEGAWTRATLDIIGKNPRIAASKLAKELGRETPPFKADVVKLKKLGLTQSFEVGYEISPRGKTFLKMLKKRG